MASRKLLNNFTGGELSPQLDARIDLQKYETGCQHIENFRCLPWGGVTRRSGTLFVAETKNSANPSRVIGFNFSTTVGYAIEMGGGYLRFFKDGARVLSASAPAWGVGNFSPVGAYVLVVGVYYRCVVEHTNSGLFATEYLISAYWVVSDAAQIIEVATIYAAADIFQIQFREINDVVYFTHPSYPVQKLARYSDTNWKISSVDWSWPALGDENTDTAKTLQLAATTAGGFIVGAFYRIVSIGSTDFTLIGASANTVGLTFQATGVGAGSGTAFQLGGSGATLVANFDAFFTGHVGSYWQLRHLRNATKTEIYLSTATPGTTTSDAINVKGDWTFVTTERWYGTVTLQRSIDGGTTWEDLYVFTSASDFNASASGSQEDAALFRVSFLCVGDPYGSPPWTGTPPTTFVAARGTFTVAAAYIAGFVVISAITDTKHATVNISQTIENETATTLWSEGAWSGYRGYPRALGLYEQRMFFAGTAAKPNTAWGSVVADFENFQYSDFDDAAVAYQFATAQQNPIQWLMPMLHLHAGTSGGEHIIASGNLDEPLTPSNVTVRDPTAYGSEYMPALKVDNAIVFLQRQGRRIREMKELSVYANPSDSVAPDLALLAEHLTDAGIVQLDYARTPDPVLYAVMGNGQLATMAYNREQNINAWSRYFTLGAFESLAVIYGSPSDVVYTIINRTINGATKRYVEVFTAENPEVPFERVDMDCAKVDNAGGTVITGLSHLEGMTVDIVGGIDGHVIGDGKLVVAGGQVALGESAEFVRVGLNYKSKLTPMKIDMVTGNGTTQGRRRRISEVAFRFRDTLGGVWGNSLFADASAGRWNVEIPFRDTDNSMDSAPPLFTGDKVLPNEGANALATDFSIFQPQPLPMTILGIFAKMEFFGD